MVRRAAEALAFAHARGLVHRDLKPSNLFLVQRDVERVVLVDFGIARLGRESQRLTRTGALLGTPGYMAPEQIEGPPASDPRADVFALGAVLFECLTGRPAFEGTSTMSVLAKILLQEVPRPRALRPTIPARLDDLVARMMARAPAERPGDGAAVAHEIAELGDPAAFPGGAAPAVDPHHLRVMAAAAAGTGSLTLSEQRLVTVVLAGEAEAESDDARISARPEIGELKLVIGPHGGVLHVLAGGSLVVTLWGAGSAVDRAARAARCALAIKGLFSELPVCVVTGRGQVSSRVVEGEMIERGVQGLVAARSGGVHIDEVTAGILQARFVIEPADGAAKPDGAALERSRAQTLGHNGALPQTPGHDGALPQTPEPGAPPGRIRTLPHAPGHILRGERPAAEAPPLLLGQATPCVGRTRELAMLAGVFSGCISEPVASGVLVVGDPGAGKSRLRREFIEELRRRHDGVEVLAGAGDSMGTASPYRMIAEALRRAAGIGEDDPLEVRRNKLRARVGRHLEGAGREGTRGDPGSARVVHFLGELCGTPFADGGDEALRAARDSARLMGDAVRSAWEELIAAECAAHPVIVVLEDLHWGDASTVRLVDGALRNLRDLPLMVLVLARPEVHERFPNLWAEREVQSIRLGPLPRRSSEQIVRAALGPLPAAATVARLVDRAEGNPFYLEELVRAVAAGRADALPDSVLGTVEARLDAEGSEAKRVLRAASVFGDRFSLGGVLALLGGEGHEADVAGWLDALVSRELIAPASSRAPSPDPNYVFCHALVRAAAYATLTDDDRTLGHRLAAEWLERADLPDAMALAEHLRRGDDATRAVHWYRRAAEQALEANDFAAAFDRAARGVACGATGEELGHLRLCQAEADGWRGELASAEEGALAALALLAPGSLAWFRALTQTVAAAGKLGGFDRIDARAELAVATAPAPGARTAQLVCLTECASFLLVGGRSAAVGGHPGAPPPRRRRPGLARARGGRAPPAALRGAGLVRRRSRCQPGGLRGGAGLARGRRRRPQRLRGAREPGLHLRRAGRLRERRGGPARRPRRGRAHGPRRRDPGRHGEPGQRARPPRPARRGAPPRAARRRRLPPALRPAARGRGPHLPRPHRSPRRRPGPGRARGAGGGRAPRRDVPPARGRAGHAGARAPHDLPHRRGAAHRRGSTGHARRGGRARRADRERGPGAPGPRRGAPGQRRAGRVRAGGAHGGGAPAPEGRSHQRSGVEGALPHRRARQRANAGAGERALNTMGAPPPTPRLSAAHDGGSAPNPPAQGCSRSGLRPQPPAQR